MKKYIIYIVIGAGIFIFATWGGWYPVAIVGYKMIFARTFWRLETSSRHFANIQLARAGQATVDFSLPEQADILLEGRREILLSLVEDAIISQSGSKVVSDFKKQAKQMIEFAVARRAGLAKEVPQLYSISLKEFERIVLLPQARREIIQKQFGSKEIFEDWMQKEKEGSLVLFFFIPFSWDGKEVR